jgi:hypothetical protein
MSFDYQGSKAVLQGITPQIQSCQEISSHELTMLEHQDQLWFYWHCNQLIPIRLCTLDHLKYNNLWINFKAFFNLPLGYHQREHTIPLIPRAYPFRLRPYGYNSAQKNEIESQVQQLLANGWIQESQSPFASLVLLVKKKTRDWRLCVDYRKLNALTVKNKFPLPVIDEMLDDLVGAKWFTTLDMSSGFHQILVVETDVAKTAFQTHNGQYEYKVMPYGFIGGSATFQYEMNTLLAPMLRKCGIVFIDDILIYSKTWAEHLQHIKEVFTLLLQHQFKVKLSKCSFAKKELAYLGHVISAKGVAIDPGKVDIIKHWPVPWNAKEVRSFLGMAGITESLCKVLGLSADHLLVFLRRGLYLSGHKNSNSLSRL